MKITKEKILQIIQKQLMRQVKHRIEIQDGIPAGCVFYGMEKVKTEPCWTARIAPEQLRTGPSRIICISKKTGRIIYDELTCDE